jgi:glutamine amidotransferase
MCRLLGLVANKPVDLRFSLERFKEFSTENPDGWGIGWYENDSARLFKESIPAEKSERFPKLQAEVASKIIIAHVRKGTGAPPSQTNSHPFKCGNWLFAHNGCVDRGYLRSLLSAKYRSELEGSTDSEVYFYWILQNIEEHEDIVTGIKQAVEQVTRKDHSGLNFLLSNGEILYAFRYSSHSRSYYSLYKLTRNPSSPGPLSLLSEHTKALIESKCLKSEKAVLVCSEELTKENWKKIGFGNILEIDANLRTKEMQIL